MQTRVPAIIILAGLGFLASLLAIHPLSVLGCAAGCAALALLGGILRRAGRLELWQVFVFVALAGYILLNYGFANVVFRVGEFPLIVGHALMFAALLLAALRSPTHVIRSFREPAVLCLLALALLSMIHLASDIPRYGLYAIRDSSLFLEAVFTVLGMAWGQTRGGLDALMKFLFVVFLLNLMYSFSFPWAESLMSWSPKSGIFLVVPVFGSYSNASLYLLAGALFCLLVGRAAVRCPRWILLLLAVAQIFALAIHQARSMYVGIAVVLLALLLLGEFRKWATLTATLAFSLGVLLVLTSIVEFKLRGRVGPVTAGFLQEQTQSLLLQPGTPGLDTIYHRWRWYHEIWERTRSSTTNLLFGEGFGRPLTDFQIAGDVAVRQPHNTHLSVLARLGLAGIILWALFHLSIMSRFIPALLMRRHMQRKFSGLVLWLFCFYMLSMIVTTVQPHLEFSYGAIPFYFLMGFALAITRRESSQPCQRT